MTPARICEPWASARRAPARLSRNREGTVVLRCDSGVVERSASRSAPRMAVSAESRHGFGDAASRHEIATRSNGERRVMRNGDASDQKLLTKGEVALLCRVEIRTVDRWVASGKLRHYRPPSGRLLFRKTDVLVMANRSLQRAAETQATETQATQTDL